MLGVSAPFEKFLPYEMQFWKLIEVHSHSFTLKKQSFSNEKIFPWFKNTSHGLKYLNVFIKYSKHDTYKRPKATIFRKFGMKPSWNMNTRRSLQLNFFLTSFTVVRLTEVGAVS